MRYLLPLLLMVPAFAQQPAQQQAPPPTTEPAQAQKVAETPATSAAQGAASGQGAPGSPAPPTGISLTGTVDFGYREVTGPGGNFQEYRSVVDLNSGPRLFGIDFTAIDPKKRFFDRIDVDAYGFGDPYNTAHVTASKLGIYDFSFGYSNIAYFDAVPSFANPNAPLGFNEQSFDIHRRNVDAELDLFTGKKIVPYLAYEHNSGYGLGIEDWVDGPSNNFPVPYNLSDNTNNYRGGVRIDLGRFHATLEQGWTTFGDNDSTYYHNFNPGDNPTPLLGQSLFLNGLAQAYGIRGNGPYSRILISANPTPWMDVFANFLYSEPRTDVTFNEAAQGNFANLATLQFYTGQDTMGTGAAIQPQATGTGGVEVRPTRRLRILESVTINREHDAASPLTTLLAVGAPPATTNFLDYSQIVNYTQQETDVMYDLTSRITLRGGYRYMRGDATVLGSELSQTGLLESGALRRHVGLGGFTYRAFEKLTVDLDYEGSSSDHIYFRTGLNDYSKGRARVRYQLNPSLLLQANFQVLNNQNPAPDVRNDFQSRDNSLSVYWTPKGAKRVSVMAEYDRSTLRSDITFLYPPFYTPTVSDYRLNAHTATSAVDVALPGVGGVTGAQLSLGGSLFVGSGSRPTQYYQPLARFSIPFGKHVVWYAAWQWYDMGEAFYLYEGFRTNIIQTGLRFSR